MSKEISIRFTWNQDLAIEASKKFYDYDMRHSNKRYFGWLFVGLTQFAIVGALKHDSYGLLYLCTFLVVYWYYGRWYIRKSMLKKFYTKIEFEKEMEFTLKDDGLYTKDKLISWDSIYKIIKFDDGILLQIDSSTLFFKRDAFLSYDDFVYFLDVMKEKGKL